MRVRFANRLNPWCALALLEAGGSACAASNNFKNSSHQHTKDLYLDVGLSGNVRLQQSSLFVLVFRRKQCRRAWRNLENWQYSDNPKFPGRSFCFCYGDSLQWVEFRDGQGAQAIRDDLKLG